MSRDAGLLRCQWCNLWTGPVRNSAWPGGPWEGFGHVLMGAWQEPRCSSWRPGSHCEVQQWAWVMPQDTAHPASFLSESLLLAYVLSPSTCQGLLLAPGPGLLPPRPRIVTTLFSPNLLLGLLPRFKKSTRPPTPWLPGRLLLALSALPSPQPRQPNFTPARLSRAPPW